MKSRLITAVSCLALCVALVTWGFFVPPAHVYGAGPSQLSLFQTAAVGSDPCQNPSVLKQSASIAITSATTTALVTPIAGNYITVCKWQLTVVGTSPTVQFEYGTVTTTACDTGATALTGAMAIPTTTIFIPATSDGLVLRLGVVGQELCLVSGGTVTGIEGYITYVQAPY